jgi:hypothetical protein
MREPHDRFPTDGRQRILAFVTLTRYWMWSVALRDAGIPLLAPEAAGKTLSDAECSRATALLSYWFASLYVLSEGWRQLGIRDSTVDTLLTEEHVSLLRRYRNGMFHFQADFGDARFTELILSSDTFRWVVALNNAFGAFFSRHVPKPDSEWLTSWLSTAENEAA